MQIFYFEKLWAIYYYVFRVKLYLRKPLHDSLSCDYENYHVIMIKN